MDNQSSPCPLHLPRRRSRCSFSSSPPPAAVLWCWVALICQCAAPAPPPLSPSWQQLPSCTRWGYVCVCVAGGGCVGLGHMAISNVSGCVRGHVPSQTSAQTAGHKAAAWPDQRWSGAAAMAQWASPGAGGWSRESQCCCPLPATTVRGHNSAPSLLGTLGRGLRICRGRGPRDLELLQCKTRFFTNAFGIEIWRTFLTTKAIKFWNSFPIGAVGAKRRGVGMDAWIVWSLMSLSLMMYPCSVNHNGPADKSLLLYFQCYKWRQKWCFLFFKVLLSALNTSKFCSEEEESLIHTVHFAEWDFIAIVMVGKSCWHIIYRWSWPYFLVLLKSSSELAIYIT